MEKKFLLVCILLSILGVVTHLLPHDYGFTTVGAIGLLAACYLPRHLVPVPVLISVFAADFIIGGYAMLSMIIVYSAHVMAALGVTWLRKRERVLTVAAAGVTNAVFFYLISNLAPLSSGFYPLTLGGVLECYVMALPFLAKGILANLVFAGIAFGVVSLWREKWRSRAGQLS